VMPSVLLLDACRPFKEACMLEAPNRRRYAALCGTLLIAALALAWFGGVPRTSRAATPELDPNAVAGLDRAKKYLRSLPAFSVSAQVTRDEVVHDDFNLQRSSQVRVLVRRPDRMRAEVSGDGGDRLFVYDGKTLNLLMPGEKYYAATPAPGTVRETIDAMLDKHAVELPLLDVIYVAMGGELQNKMLDAGEIGTSIIDGVACTQLAFRGEKVDWQLWVEQGAKPLPRKVVITTTDEPTRPQYSAILRWDVAVNPPDAQFTFTPPAGALPIALAEVQPSAVVSGAKKPPAEAKPATKPK
jgi:hypothetical protein